MRCLAASMLILAAAGLSQEPLDGRQYLIVGAGDTVYAFAAARAQ
jgi:hypothetical protein